MKLNKKGSLMDPILSGAYILKVVITIFIALAIWFGFQTAMGEAIAGTSSESLLTPIMTSLTSAYTSIDYMFPFLVGGLLTISMIFAFKTGANFIWAIVSILFWALAVLFATVFTNVYIAVSNEFPTIYAQMPIMDIIMLNMRWLALGWIAAITAVMFRKNNVEDEASEIQRRAYGYQ